MASNRRVDSTCVCHVCDGLRSKLNRIFFLLKEFGWLLDTYIVDFFEDDVWNKLPSSWRKVLGETSLEELGNWVIGKKHGIRVWPLSLLAFRTAIKYLEINRDYENKEIIKCCQRQKSLSKKCGTTDTVKKKQLDEEHQQLFTRSVKMKKRHEIDNISKVTSECANFSSCECIVDFGAGMGHLARTLAFNYGLCVVCLEQNEFLSSQAKICDEKLLIKLKKKNPELFLRSPYHVSTRIVESDVQNKKLATNLKNDFSRFFELDQDKSGFGMIGLHTCGDLAANLIRFYSEQGETRFICIVGCCYMKITCGIMENAKFGYPMSNYVSKAKDHEFSYSALEVACHAIENYCDKLITGDYHDLLVHAYRATLEMILVRKNGPSIRRSHLKNVKLKNDSTFEGYCEAAIENLKPENRPNVEDFRTDEVKKCLSRWREVVAFGTLRFMLAPLVETAVLFDRFLYLSERNFVVSLQPVFDPRISPRNIVLTSYK